MTPSKPAADALHPVLEQALWLAAQGIFVNTIRPNTKELVKGGAVMANATRDPAVIRAIFKNPNLNLAVVPGPQSGVFIVDVDTKNKARGMDAMRALEKACGKLEPTLFESTPSGGLHYFYKLTDGVDVPNGKLDIDGILGVEIFGRPHNVVTAPSVIDGKNYTVIERRTIVEMPRPMLEYVLAHVVKGAKARGPITEERNNRMYREACRLRRFNTPEDEAWQKLLVTNSTLCVPPLTEHELKKAFRSAWNHSPSYEMTELGNSERFSDHHGENLKFVRDTKNWLHWDGLCWAEDRSDRAMHLMKLEMRRMLHEAREIPNEEFRKPAVMWAKKSEARNVMQHSLQLVPSERGMTMCVEDLDPDPWLIATKNAVLDLRTGRPVSATREQLITKRFDVTHDPKAQCPTFLKFVEQILPSEPVREFIKRYFGYAMTGDTREQCMVICWGSGANGKTTLLNTFLNMWGEYGRTTPATTWVQSKDPSKIRNDLASLTGRRLVISSEFEQNQQMAASLLKGATGQEKQSVRFLFNEYFEMTPLFKVAFAANHIPLIDGSDSALVRRLRLVEFGRVIPEEERDKALPEKLKAEASGILNWLLDGCQAWLNAGLSYPDEVRKSTSEYAESNDSLGQFIDERCEVAEAHDCTAKAIYMAYMAWCAQQGSRPASTARFKRGLNDRGYVSIKTKSSNKFVGIRPALQHEVAQYSQAEY